MCVYRFRHAPLLSILDFRVSDSPALDIVSLISSISLETLLVIALYVVLGGLYLVVIPLLLYGWMSQRWPRMGKVERLVIYGLVFLFFPGMVVFAPFLNLRLSGQGDV